MSDTINSSRSRRGRRLLAASTASVAAGAGVLLFGITGAAADPAFVILCHATASTTNPYRPIKVPGNSIQNKIFGPNGHGTHVGPIFDPNGGKNQPAWGDIIPAFDYSNPVIHYPGLNYTPEGIAILNGGCAIPNGPSPTVTVTESDTPTDTASAAPSSEASSAAPVVTVTETPNPIPGAVEAGRHGVSSASIALGTGLMLAGGAGVAFAVRRRSAHAG
ncbi:MAG TPA: hypothetical protein VJ831_11655 [Jatrophihabitantaceae bacterium]|nr:hypothetical protein [Jatrophihabitantaceae bacterium]